MIFGIFSLRRQPCLQSARRQQRGSVKTKYTASTTTCTTVKSDCAESGDNLSIVLQYRTGTRYVTIGILCYLLHIYGWTGKTREGTLKLEIFWKVLIASLCIQPNRSMVTCGNPNLVESHSRNLNFRPGLCVNGSTIKRF